jgi:hypothetical protein
VASGPFSSPDYRHGTHIMAASIFCIPWSQYSQPSFLDWTGLHLQSWCYPFSSMADSCSRSKNQAQSCNSKPPLSYKFWNMVATVSGFVIPLMVLLGSQKGTLHPSCLLFIMSIFIFVFQNYLKKNKKVFNFYYFKLIFFYIFKLFYYEVSISSLNSM